MYVKLGYRWPWKSGFCKVKECCCITSGFLFAFNHLILKLYDICMSFIMKKYLCLNCVGVLSKHELHDFCFNRYHVCGISE